MSRPDRPARAAVRPTGVALALSAPLWLWMAAQAPLDSVQGVVQKIVYVHPPCAFAAYLGFACTALGGALYLWRRDEAWDRFAASSAEVGVLFCALVIATGPLWARGTWGRSEMDHGVEFV